MAALEQKETQQATSREVDKPTSTSTPTSTFWNRLGSIPVVQDTIHTLETKAGEIQLGRLVVDQAQATITRVQSLTQPFEPLYRPLLSTGESLGCMSLDALESRFPIIQKPTADLVQEIKETPSRVYSTIYLQVDDTVNRVQTPLVTQIHGLVDRWMPAEKDEQQREAKRHVAPDQSFSQLAHKISDRFNRWLTYRLDSAHTTPVDRLVQGTTYQIVDPHSFINERINNLASTTIAGVDATSTFITKHGPGLPVFIDSRIQPWRQRLQEEYSLIRTEALKPDVSPLQKASTLLKTHAILLSPKH
ncbi:hypothetical protein PHYBLDRAFT_159441 [Phycomyces blakesleeanus NRRL 1555(-)]|uniref:Uncharacterized protein n=1 Tax=Phycomyces blakesleeanus (strain ATCC 8743b / DSM 1359 / FGSC 10004 / NBRC 33097 / NRRL 1555) TaxID=763407 RepID=A0A162TSY0_PHYB8|nr:hypothetical protein PHYBLDRAFT_159441 [Phycomyces blakesleeanus NRRL 1555(-)]OAD70722.1 hypothetical protein PHYBLDRAFT_159441 [Phycomyces blakesleeanus NRRL 1555(-)]|eukprot:XP_018288762.1 hypothetical protein PHYBLDRAFT_159441 [Phycomyces blakesleeanus NRRL 1555(-)]